MEIKWVMIMLAAMFLGLYGYLAIDSISSNNAKAKQYSACIAHHSVKDCKHLEAHSD